MADPSPAGVIRLSLRHPRGATEILCGTGAMEAAGELLGSWVDGRTAFLVSTPRVEELHGPGLGSWVHKASRLVRLQVPEGEKAKGLRHAEDLWRRMVVEGGRRDSRVVAFGGGSVGDLAGFVAGTFLRGVEHAQIPTTLLAQVDAAVGGKTGIDLPEAKNSVGLFHHPAAVVADPRWLSTLSQRELAAGLVEAVKMGFLLDPDLLSLIEERLVSILAGEEEALMQVVASSVAAKVRVVEEDPEESDARRLLNFGHTLGHALETVLGYRGLRHGEAVAYGILFALRLAERRGLAAAQADRLRRLLARLGLPPLPPLAAADLLAVMRRDKKSRETGLAWVLPAATGDGRVVDGVAEGEVARELEAFLASPQG